MVFVVLVAFVICWTPFQALVLVYSLNHNAAIHGAVSSKKIYSFLLSVPYKAKKTVHILSYT